jgi:hypothetical protein
MTRVISLIARATGLLALTACANGNGAGVPITSAFLSQTLLAKPETTNLFKDGGFEKPPVPSGSFLVFSTGQKFEKWVVVGANGNVGIVSGTFTQNGFDFPAKSGKQWVDLTGTTQTATGLSQTLATRANAKYKLVFWVGNVYDPSGIFGVSSTVNVLVDGQQIFTATNSRKSTTQVWRKFSTTITATSSKTKIALMNGDPANDTNNGLDDVQLFAQ